MASKKRNTRTMNFASLPREQLKCVAEIVISAIDLRIADRADMPLKGNVLDNILSRARDHLVLLGRLFKHVDALNALLLQEEATERASRPLRRPRSKTRARARSQKK